MCAESLEKIGELAGGSTSSLVARIVAANEEIPVKSLAAGALKQMGTHSVELLMEQIAHRSMLNLQIRLLVLKLMYLDL